MMKVYEIESPKGVLRQEFYPDVDDSKVVSMLEQFVVNEDWYRISVHNCFNDEGKPCAQWKEITRKGVISKDDI